MHPTVRAMILVGSAIPVSLLIAMFEEDSWLWGATYLGTAVALVLLDAVLAPPPGAVGLYYRLPRLLQIGSSDPLEIKPELRRGRRPVVVEITCDTGPTLAAPANLRMGIEPGGEHEGAIELTPLRRGMARVERLWIRWHGPFGLMWRRSLQEIGADVPVVPNVRAVRAAALRFFARDAPMGQKVQTQPGDGSEFDALRDYVPGLDRRSVDWKHSARHLKLVCKEFKTERNHNIILAFDTGHLMSEPLDGMPKLDRAINAGLLLAYASLREGDRVGLFGFDSRVQLYAEPISNVRNFQRIQHTAAELDYRYDETNYTLGLTHLAGRLNRRSLVVLMTDFVDTVTAEMMVENVERLANKHLVMFVSFRDPALEGIIDTRPRSIEDMTRSTVASDFVRERNIVMERLDRMGVHCLDTPHETVDSAMINRYLLIKQRELI